jgi:hypothetical protein
MLVTMKLLIAALVYVAASARADAPVVIEGIAFQPTAQVGGQVLELNGAGLRTRAFFKVYAAGLYVPQKSNSAAALLNQKGARLVAMTMLRDVDADTMFDALSKGLKANHTEQQLAGFASQIGMLQADLRAMGEAREGNVIRFEFTPEAGTRIVVDGQQKGNAIPGDAFFTAVLRNWIGDEPVDADLKRALVGF